ELRRVRRDGREPRRLLAARRRRGLPRLRRAGGRARAQPGRAPRQRGAAGKPARGGGVTGADAACGPRRAAPGPGVVRVPRRLPTADALRLGRGRAVVAVAVVVANVVRDELLERLELLERRLGVDPARRRLAEEPRRRFDRGLPRDLLGLVAAAVLRRLVL